MRGEKGSAVTRRLLCLISKHRDLWKRKEGRNEGGNELSVEKKERNEDDVMTVRLSECQLPFQFRPPFPKAQRLQLTG